MIYARFPALSSSLRVQIIFFRRRELASFVAVPQLRPCSVTLLSVIQFAALKCLPALYLTGEGSQKIDAGISIEHPLRPPLPLF